MKIVTESFNVSANFLMGIAAGLVAKGLSDLFASGLAADSSFLNKVGRLFLHGAGFVLGLALAQMLMPRVCGDGPCAAAFAIGFISTSPLPERLGRSLLKDVRDRVGLPE